MLHHYRGYVVSYARAVLVTAADDDRCIMQKQKIMLLMRISHLFFFLVLLLVANDGWFPFTIGRWWILHERREHEFWLFSLRA